MFFTESIRSLSSRRPQWIGFTDEDREIVVELCDGSWNGLRTELKESDEASLREGFEVTHIVRFEQDMAFL